MIRDPTSSRIEAHRSVGDVDVPTVQPIITDRRRLLIEASGIALSGWILGQPLPVRAVEPLASPRTIVVTGANSGIGLEACKRLADQGHRIVLACRTLQKARDTAELLRDKPGQLIPAECDLADTRSMQAFATDLPKLIGSQSKLDTVCLNAGLARNTAAKDVARTADGFELTVGTNHFGHFYLNHLLLPMLQTDARIVVTASGVHDPESPGGAQGTPATLGALQGLETDGRACTMIDGGSFNPDKAYKDSKLCNVLFTRELQRRLLQNDNTKNVSANCFNPGLIVGTNFFRDQNPVFTKLFDFAATDLFKVGETPEWGGGCLAYMTSISSRGQYYTSDPGSSKYGDKAYGDKFTVSATSKEALDDIKAKRLWELSEKLLGITV
jgi:protochlorophyllide reductase